MRKVKKALCALLFGHRKKTIYSDGNVRIQECDVCGAHWLTYLNATVRTDIK